MPKQSEKKRLEREAAQKSLKSEVREKKPFENYLGYVKEVNKKNIDKIRSDSPDSQKRGLS